MLQKYLSLVKFSHTIFALPFAMVGVFLGYLTLDVMPNIWLLTVKVVLCMVFARTAAMAFNRWADRKIDADNPRTRSREIPSGVLRADRVLGFAIINAVLFVATAYAINMTCFLLSPIALLVVMGYSYTKRF
ncbi:MAG: UbiA family prenyltransferase, partial [Saprospiraceae bacterium]|nr:UbiA family prenyltransferase [Saprospiraceae bacterium]